MLRKLGPLVAVAASALSVGAAWAQPFSVAPQALTPRLQASLDAEGRTLPPNGSCETEKPQLIGALQRVIAASGAQPGVASASLRQVVGDTTCKTSAIDTVLRQIDIVLARDELRPQSTTAGGSLVTGMPAEGSSGGSDYRGR